MTTTKQLADACRSLIESGSLTLGQTLLLSVPLNSLAVELAESRLPITEVRRGWRAFKCEQCGAVFARPIANISSDALDKISWCMGCKDCFATFVRSLPDPELKVDAHGNLLNGGV